MYATNIAFSNQERYFLSMNHFELYESYIPFDLTEPRNFLIACAALYFVIMLRYFIVAGTFYFIFWKKYPDKFQRQQIYKELPDHTQIRKEIKWSTITSVIFAIGGVLTGVAWQEGYTQIYLRFDEYPYWYMPVSLVLMSLVHEFYFYFTHVWMHQPKLFRIIHKVHHDSLKPSPWASFSFHPYESIVQAAILPILMLIFPVHPVVFLTYLTLMTISAVINHLGFETLQPEGWSKHLISAGHHSDHHHYFKSNYGLYFTFIDKLFGTETKK